MKQVLGNGEISRLMSESGVGGISGEAHLLKYGGKKYFLRKSLNEKRADEYFDIYSKLEKHGFFPRLLYREGKDLLFEFIEGRDCQTKDALQVAYDIGKIFGLISQIPVSSENKFDLDQKFFKSLKFLLEKGIIDKEKYSRIEEKYKELRGKVELAIILDISDCIPSNFRIREGKVYLVDIDSVRYRFRGRGIAKAFLRWFKKEEEREKFLEGYGSVASTDFLTEDYLNISYLYFLIVNTKIKIDEKRDYGVNLKDLDLLLEGKLK